VRASRAPAGARGRHDVTQALLWLFARPLLVALPLIYLLAHGLLLGRLDHEDEQRLVAKAIQIWDR